MNLDEAEAHLRTVAEEDMECPDCNEMARVVLDGLSQLRERLAEHERTQATGGPAPAETRNWGNEQHVPPPESASRRDMDPPARYGASNAERSKQ